jgi:hypothetical protein
VRAAIDEIPEGPLADYPETGEAEIAETTLGRWRLIVRRVRTIGAQEQLFETWQQFAFVTNRSEPLEIVEAEQRAHAVVELAIRDLKTRGRAETSRPPRASAAWRLASDPPIEARQHLLEQAALT